jgi:hypothetical protein
VAYYMPQDLFNCTVLALALGQFVSEEKPMPVSSLHIQLNNRRYSPSPLKCIQDRFPESWTGEPGAIPAQLEKAVRDEQEGLGYFSNRSSHSTSVSIRSRMTSKRVAALLSAARGCG